MKSQLPRRSTCRDTSNFYLCIAIKNIHVVYNAVLFVTWCSWRRRLGYKRYKPTLLRYFLLRKASVILCVWKYCMPDRLHGSICGLDRIGSEMLQLGMGWTLGGIWSRRSLRTCSLGLHASVITLCLVTVVVLQRIINALTYLLQTTNTYEDWYAVLTTYLTVVIKFSYWLTQCSFLRYCILLGFRK